MSAPSVRRVGQLSGHKAPDVFFASLREADDNLAELDALRESAVRVDELLAENADLRRQLAELREQQEWGQS